MARRSVYSARCCCSPPPPPAGAVAGYGDITEGRYFTDPVQWASDNNITGIDGPCFDPDAPVTRGETAVWLWNMQNQPQADNHGFSDIADPAQNQAISWMVGQQITTGTSPTTYSPNDTLTRAQIAAFLHRLEGKPQAPVHSFSDVPTNPGHWQQQPVSWMVDQKITTGTSPTTFSPNDTLTRAHLVTFLYRYQNGSSDFRGE